MKGGGGQVVLLPRGRDAIVARSSGGSAGVIMGVGKVGGLHGGGDGVC